MQPRQARENARQVGIGFAFTSDWLRKLRKIFSQSQTVAIQNQSNNKVEFDTQLKTALSRIYSNNRAALLWFPDCFGPALCWAAFQSYRAFSISGCLVCHLSEGGAFPNKYAEHSVNCSIYSSERPPRAAQCPGLWIEARLEVTSLCNKQAPRVILMLTCAWTWSSTCWRSVTTQCHLQPRFYSRPGH